MPPSYLEESYEDFMQRTHEEFKTRAKAWREANIPKWQKPTSPYVLNEKLLETIQKLNIDFNNTLEKEVLNLINQISDYPNMSLYQLSLSKKALAECYLNHGITGNALEFFEDGLADNPNLPVKRQVKKLKNLPANELVYSLDKNAIYEYDSEISSTLSFPVLQDDKEYDEEFEAYIDEELEKLGVDCRKAFNLFLRQRDFEKDYRLPYKQWVELTLKSFWASKNYAEQKSE